MGNKKRGPLRGVRYSIVLRSRWTGEEIHLGVAYDTHDEAWAWAKKECCARCNYISVHPVYEGAVWRNKHVGFR